MINKLKNIISDFENTNEAFIDAYDLYDYTLTQDNLKDATFKECETAFNQNKEANEFLNNFNF